MKKKRIQLVKLPLVTYSSLCSTYVTYGTLGNAIGHQLLPTHPFTASATDLRERFLLSGVFHLTLLPDIWHNLLLSRLPWKLAVLPWRLQGLPLRFKTQSQSICLFESHSVQQKVLVGRFYSRVTAGWLVENLPLTGFELFSR